MLRFFNTFISLSFLLYCFLFQSCVTPNNGIGGVEVKGHEFNYLENDDGPYITLGADKLIFKSVVNGTLQESIVYADSLEILFAPEKSTYSGINKMAVISDLHGQYDIVVKILRNNNIIDKNNNWKFGRGHLVVLGDILDRGDKVTEVLWLIYNLEQQAKQKGGKVHFLLGNHEVMVMHNDLRYVHEKYNKVTQLLDTPYNELFGSQTLFGRWMRSKPTVIKINDILFVHGGISKEFIVDGFDINYVNKVLRESLDRDKTEMKKGPFYDKYYRAIGPFWYRGYFEDNLSKEEISQLLAYLNVNHIIVGHTSLDRIEKLYDGKIYGVDSSIKNGEYGEILFIKRNKFKRGTMDGKQNNFD